MTDSFSRFQLLKTWEARERKKAREYDREQEKEGEKKDEQVLYSGKCSLFFDSQTKCPCCMDRKFCHWTFRIK